MNVFVPFTNVLWFLDRQVHQCRRRQNPWGSFIPAQSGNIKGMWLVPKARITINSFSSHCLIPDTAFSCLLMQHLTSTRATLKSWLIGHRLSIIHNVKSHYYSLQNCGCWAPKFGTRVIPISVKYSPRSVSVSLLQIIPSFTSFNFSPQFHPSMYYVIPQKF